MGSKLGTAAICLLFAVIFGGVGAGASWVIGKTISDGMRAKEWVLVKANVDAFNRGLVTYRYTFQGREYKGDRMGSEILGGTDNLDSWHNDMADLLSTAKKEGKPITVFVNPDNPSESMIDRTIRWKLMLLFLPFALGFGGVGVGALWFLGKTLIGEAPSKMPGYKQRVTGVQRAAAVGRGQGAGVLGLWVFAFFWNLIAIPIAVLAVPDMIRDGEWIGLLVLLFPLFGLLMIWGAISATINLVRQRFRRASESASMPQMPEAAQIAVAPAASGPPGTSTVFARGMINDPAPAPSSAPTAAASSIRSFDDVLGDDAASAPAAPAATSSPAQPDLEGVLKLFNKNAKLTPQQSAALAKLTPEQKAMLGKVSGWVPSLRKYAVWIIGLIFALQFLPSILSYLRNP